MRRLALLLLAAPLSWGQGYTTAGGGTISSPIATDPLSFTGVVTFDNAAGTAVTFADGGRFSDGTLAAPGIAFSAATGTGLNRNVLGFGELGVGVAGTRALTFLTTGVHVPNALTLWFGNSTSDTNVGLKWASTGVVKVTDGGSGGGDWQIGTGILTTATMTQESAALAKTVTSSYTWTNAQVVALGAALTGDITVATLPAKTQLLDAAIVVTGAAVGPTTVTASLGDAIGATPFINLIVPSDIKAAANSYYGDAAAERGTSIDSEFWYLPSYTATTLVTLHVISTGANLNTVTGSTGRIILTTRLLP